MSLAALLAELRSRDIRLWADGGELRCNAPAGALTEALREELRGRKAELIEFLRNADAAGQQPQAIVPMQPHGSRVPVYALGGHNGDVFAFRDLVRHLGEDQPFFGLQPPGLDGRSEPLKRVEDFAAYYLAQIRAFQPAGAFIIAGYCAGGGVAFELARQALQSGAELDFVALFGCPHPTLYRFSLPYWGKRVALHTQVLAGLSGFEERRDYVAERLRRRLRALRDERTPEGDDAVSLTKFKFEQAMIAAVRRYTPVRFGGRLCLFIPNREWLRSGGAATRWRAAAPQAEEYYGPDSVDPDRMLIEPHVPQIAELFRRARDGSASQAAS